MAVQGPEIVIRGLIPNRTVRLVPGTVTWIAGPNGAGKTHLLEQLAGLRPPGNLAIAWGDRPLWERSRWPGGRPRPRREALMSYSYAAQDADAMLFARTVEEELRYTLRPYRLSAAERSRRIAAALDAFGWEPAALARDPFRMSGGERRRVALMAALASPAPWLLLDEPTVGLDAEGERQLAAALRKAREDGRGVVLVSHDWDWALPLADRLLVVRGIGRAPLWIGRTALLAQPELTAEAGVEPPPWLPLARAAWRRGVPEPDVWDPVSLARHPEAWQALAETTSTGVPERGDVPVRDISAGDGSGETGDAGPEPRPAGREAVRSDCPRVRPIAAADGDDRALAPPAGSARAAASGTDRDHACTSSNGNRDRGRTAAGGNAAGRLARFDPRALLAAYALLSFGLIQMREWRDLMAGALAVAAVVAWGRVPLRRWRGLIAGWLLLALFISLLAGWTGPVSGEGDSGTGIAQAGRTIGGFVKFDVAQADRTLRVFAGTLLAMLPGVGLLAAMSPLRLRSALERLFRFRGRTPDGIRWMALAVALMLRFVPVLIGEWERFARLALARGKIVRATPAAWFRRLRDQSVPLLLAMFRLAEESAAALESRGAGRSRPAGTGLAPAKWRGRDTALVAGAALLAAALLVVTRL